MTSGGLRWPPVEQSQQTASVSRVLPSESPCTDESSDPTAVSYLKDQKNAAALSDRNKREGYEPGTPVTDAVEQVLDEIYDEIVCINGGHVRTSREALSRIFTRIKEPLKADPVGSYVDRKGTVHWPFRAGLEIAQRLCAAEPSTVLVAIEAREREWATKAFHS